MRDETLNDQPQEVDFEVEGQDVEIEIVDDTPPEDRNRKPMEEPPKEFSEDEIATYNENVQKRIKHFTKGYHEERRAKEAALREREEAFKYAQAILEENKKLKSTVSENQEVLLEQVKKATQIELDKAKEDYKKAYDSGDSDALVAAQESLTAAKIKADRVFNFKLPTLQQENTELKPEYTPTPPKRDVKAETWGERNKWFGRDNRMTAYALAFSKELTDVEGVDPTSDEYYQRIDAEMRQRFPEKLGSSDAIPQKKPNVVAPAARSTASKKVVLTKSQVDIAKKLGVPVTEYVKALQKLEEGGV